MKFIHTADLHLGYKYSSSFSNELLDILMENQRKVLTEIIDLSIEKNVDAVFIAGDLFDIRNPEEDLYRFVVNELERAKCNIFIACGNHDPLGGDSVYFKDFPSNVYIFPENTVKHSFDEYDVYGSSFSNSHKTENSFSGFKVDDENKINIMVLHGELISDSFYNPVPISDIEKSGLDYLALGHIHIDDGIKKAGKTYYGYSGTPQGSTFKETHNAKVILCEMRKDFINTEEIAVNKHSFKNIEIDISDSLSDDEAVKIIKSHLSCYDVSKTLFSILLKGYIDKSYVPDVKYITEKTEGVLYMNLDCDLRTKYNIELLKEEKSIRGEFVRNALKKLEGMDEEYIKKVIEYGVNRI